jgi:pimeloyl-ACP methyl ester carboxylesterase
MVGLSLRKPNISSLSLTCTLAYLAISLTVANASALPQKPNFAMTDNNDCVILLHGLGRSARAMNRLENTLSADYSVINVDYPSRKLAINQLAKITISEALQQCQKDARVHFVTHSLGGILVRQYLQNHKIENLGRTIMLGPPNRGSELADFLANNILFEFYNGPAGQQLGTGKDSVPLGLGQVGFELGVIAGNRSFNPVLTKLSSGEHDGIVSVDSSKVEGMTDHIVMPVTHTFMMMDSSVIQQVQHFLSHGKFDHQANARKPLDDEKTMPSTTYSPNSRGKYVQH